MGRLRRKRRKNSRPVKMKQGQMADWLLFLGDGIDRGISLRRLVNMSQRLYPKWQGMFDEIDQAMLMGKPFAEALGPWLSVDTYYQLRLADQSTTQLFEKRLGISLTRYQILQDLLEQAPCNQIAVQERLQIDPAALTRHFKILEKEGFVYSQRTSGRFVTDNRDLILQARQKLSEEEVKNFVNNMTRFGYHKEELPTIIADYIKGV